MPSQSPGSKSVAVRPEDMLEDEVDERVINGVRIRKGTLGAFVINAPQIEGDAPESPKRAEMVTQLRELVPAVRALGMLEVCQPRSPQVRDLIADTESA